ncbi:alpha/beta hydrolase family protein [Oryzihumus sp.]|uniref:alpha/beta hydrolase family protein n=1 Tax=Oryzihumus sp. TaxID=1968903 RepID=UPI002ED7E7C5
MASPTPTLTLDVAGDGPQAGALVLHGGQQRSGRPVHPWNLAALRMLPFARRIAEVGDGRIAVARLRYAVRGWNAPGLPPVADTEWALDQLRARLGDLPVALVGHSMGGRSAIYAAGHDSVTTVVGLAPWIEQGDPSEQLHGRQVLFVHGTADRMTSHRATANFANRLKAEGVDVTLVHRLGERHAMLRNASAWHDLVADFTCSSLVGAAPSAVVDTRDDAAS